jgi:hypothetical protein
LDKLIRFTLHFAKKQSFRNVIELNLIIKRALFGPFFLF